LAFAYAIGTCPQLLVNHRTFLSPPLTPSSRLLNISQSFSVCLFFVKNNSTYTLDCPSLPSSHLQWICQTTTPIYDTTTQLFIYASWWVVKHTLSCLKGRYVPKLHLFVISYCINNSNWSHHFIVFSFQFLYHLYPNPLNRLIWFGCQFCLQTILAFVWLHLWKINL
jgi:hypothetical protein